jgi:hypothetical protein
MFIKTDNFLFYIVIGLAALPAPLGACAALYFNIKTSWLVRDIQAIYKSQGSKWPFWTDMSRLMAFVFRPDSLLMEMPQLAHEEKVLLINHRHTMKRYLVRTFILMFTSFGLAIILLIIFALVLK